jgi:hypothetical protein
MAERLPYGFTPVEGGGSREDDVLQPVGEYAMSCLGRERVFEYLSRKLGIPMAIIMGRRLGGAGRKEPGQANAL